MNEEYSVAQQKEKSLLYSVFSWMTVALSLTAFTAYMVASQPGWVKNLVAKPFLFFGLMILQVVLVVIFSFMLPKISYFTALTLFLFYAFLNGVTFSVLFLVYAHSSIAQVFFVTAGMFAVMAIYGYFTKADLSKLGSILTMALFGMIIALLVNLYFKSPMANLVISWIGVVVFAGLTAYDVNNIKKFALALQGADKENYLKMGLFGALQLYLDFINLFISLLNIMGRRQD